MRTIYAGVKDVRKRSGKECPFGASLSLKKVSNGLNSYSSGARFAYNSNFGLILRHNKWNRSEHPLVSGRNFTAIEDSSIEHLIKSPLKDHDVEQISREAYLVEDCDKG